MGRNKKKKPQGFADGNSPASKYSSSAEPTPTATAGTGAYGAAAYDSATASGAYDSATASAATAQQPTIVLQAPSSSARSRDRSDKTGGGVSASNNFSPMSNLMKLSEQAPSSN